MGSGIAEDHEGGNAGWGEVGDCRQNDEGGFDVGCGVLKVEAGQSGEDDGGAEGRG